jgi:hypothetical protein
MTTVVQVPPTLQDLEIIYEVAPVGLNVLDEHG